MSTTAHVAPTSVAVVPGDEQHVVLHVRNGGDIVESYQLTVVGDASGWTSVEPENLTLYPGTDGTATLAFRPPRSSGVRAGVLPYAVRVLPSERPGEVVVPEGTVEVLPFHELEAEVVPPVRQRRLRARFQVRVVNLGNTPVTVALAVGETSEDVRHSLATETLTLQPGEETYVNLTVRPRKLLWFGTGVQHPFGVRLRRDGEEEDAAVPSGTYVQQPLLPRWLLALIALLLVLLALWFALALPAVRSAAREQADDAIEEAVEETPLPTPSPSGGAAGQTGGGSQDQGQDSTGPGEDQQAGPQGNGGGEDSGTGGSGGGEGDEFATVLQTSVAPGGSDTAVYQVPDDRLLLITDLLADAPQGDTGTLRVTINDITVTSLALENFRSHDNHWVTPIEAPPGSTIELSVTCREPGSPPGAPAPATCEESLFVTGTQVMLAPDPENGG